MTRLTPFLLAAVLLALAGCGQDDPQAFNAAAINDFDRVALAEAMAQWNATAPGRAALSIDADGPSVAIYADHSPEQGWWQPRDGGHEISIRNPAKVYLSRGYHVCLWRHELGHALGYAHGEHQWVAQTAC